MHYKLPYRIDEATRLTGCVRLRVPMPHGIVRPFREFRLRTLIARLGRLNVLDAFLFELILEQLDPVEV